ncbi:MAG TPA: hypothetical protein VFP92_10590 [Rhodanobacteraceae bacterium]|nr:hypothetical protein [Rhodanobacteraceae bacterium]
MYRRTSKYAKRRQWHPRPVVAEDEQRPIAWRPPKLRRRITIEDFDGAEQRTHVVELFRTSRIDSYRAVIDGQEWKARIGWSRVLDGLRRAMPRLASPRYLAQ